MDHKVDSSEDRVKSGRRTTKKRRDPSQPAKRQRKRKPAPTVTSVYLEPPVVIDERDRLLLLAHRAILSLQAQLKALSEETVVSLYHEAKSKYWERIGTKWEMLSDGTRRRASK